MQVYNKNLVFTTGSRLVAWLLGKVCQTVNVTDTSEEYHCQASLLTFRGD